MQRLFTYNIQTKVGSNLNRYTYVLNNPLKYTDPSGYAYYGYGGANASAGVMQNRCLISQQIEDFETRRSAFLSNQWHDVTLFDMIGDRGGAVSAQYVSGSNLFFGFTSLTDNSPQAFVQNYFAFRTALSFANQEYYWELRIRGSIMLKEVVCEATSVNAQGGGWLDFANNANNLFGAVTGILGANYGLTSNQAIRYAKQIGGETRSATVLSRASRMHSLSVAKTLGKVSVVGGALGVTYSLVNIYSDFNSNGNGYKDVNGWDISDALVGGVGVAVFFVSNPVGWVAGIGVGIYFGARAVHDISNKP